MPRRWISSTITDIQSVGDRFRLLQLESEEKLEFVAGQFLTFDLPIGEKRIERWRSYSIANAPHRETIELCISRVPKGPASDYLFENIRCGDILQHKAPDGQFILPEHLDRPLIFICTGTGIAPFRSMIQHIYEYHLDHHEIILIYGSRYKDDILYHDEWNNYMDRDERFRYYVALSQEEYGGYQGYVHGLYSRLESQVIRHAQVYLCGWQNMVDQAQNILIKELEVPATSIKYELYG